MSSYILSQKVRLVPSLNIAAINQGYDRELLMWYLIRSLSPEPNQQRPLDLEWVYKVLVRDLKLYSFRCFHQHLALGEGIFWKRFENGHTRIEIKGIKKISEYLDTLPDHFVDLDIKEIPRSGKLLSRRALLWNIGAYKPKELDASPISRQFLTKKTGIERRKQQRYDAVAETTREETIVKYRDEKTHKFRVKKVPIKTAKGVLQLPKQLGNIYHSKGQASSRGMVGRVRKAMVKRTGLSKGGEVQTKVSIVRCFFKTFSHFTKYISRRHLTDLIGYYPTKKNPLVYVECLIWK